MTRDTGPDGSSTSTRRQLFEPLPDCDVCGGTGIEPAYNIAEPDARGVLQVTQRKLAQLCTCTRELTREEQKARVT